MRRVMLGHTGIETSVLGFGCASLGSRVGAAAGRRALEEAHAEGVTWFDLAPVYGGGEAEAIAAPFLRANRDRVQVATKAGLSLAAGGALRRRLAPLARGALALAGPAAARLKRAAPEANAKPPLTPDRITASLDASLSRLGLDHVDLFALHAPEAGEVGRDDVLAALEAALAAGKARAVAVAGDAAAAAAALAVGAPYGVVQLAVPRPGDAAAAGALEAARAEGLGTIVHSVFGGAGAADPDEARRRLARAFALNPGGVVLVSMLSAKSRAATLMAAMAPAAAGPAAAGGR